MKVADLKLIFSDIETLRGFSLFSFYIEDKWYEFHISTYRNDLFALLKFLDDYKDYYFVFFNGLKFDGQVIQAVVRRHKRWLDYSNFETSRTIWEFAQDVIDLTNNDRFPPYREESLCIKIIDVFEIPHFSNVSRRTSLKWLEFMMDLENIEEMPHHHTKEEFTEAEIEEIVSYCRNDIIAEMKWWNYLTGNVSHEFYRGKNKIQDRLDLIDQGLLPPAAISYSDSKIGDELNKRSYCALTGHELSKLYELKKLRGPTLRFTYGDAIPKYVKFKTPELKAFYNSVKDVVVSLSDADVQEFPIVFRGTKYLIKRGGIHTDEKLRTIVPDVDKILRDADVGAQYPNAISKRGLFGRHLGKEWNKMASKNIDLKDYYKQQGKREDVSDDQQRIFKGLEGMYKLALNAGLFGKTLERTNWQYAPEVGYYCTIGNQFEILLLIEMLEIEGIHCISANTDGIVCLFDKRLDEKYYQVCHNWEKIVGNDVKGKLEYTDFKILAQESINHYIAVKSDGKVKVKGRFETEGELNKNNTDKIGRIERKAIVAYFSKNIPIEETIRKSENIFDFCIGLKSSARYKFQTIDLKDSTISNHKKIIRFFISNTGYKLIKVKNEGAKVKGAGLNRIVDGFLVTMFNKYEKKLIEEYNINYDFYIRRALSIANKIENNRKNKKYKEPPKEQLSLNF